MSIIKANFAEGGGLAWVLENHVSVPKTGHFPATVDDPLVALRQLQFLSGAAEVQLVGACLTESERGYARKNDWRLV
jgi:hypothetical protein